MSRPDWDEYFMGFARAASVRATCDRKHVGAVVVVDKQVVATGYNGSVAGAAHCDDAGHLMENGSCVRTIHAEMNALAQAARRGARVDGSTIYTTASPCWPCFRVLVNAGVRKFVYAERYLSGGRDDSAKIAEVCASTGVEVVQFVQFGPTAFTIDHHPFDSLACVAAASSCGFRGCDKPEDHPVHKP